jgi:hypothetical protein
MQAAERGRRVGFEAEESDVPKLARRILWSRDRKTRRDYLPFFAWSEEGL